MKDSRDRIFAIASALAVAVGLIAGWSMMGGRGIQRSLEADRLRVSALRAMAVQARSIATRQDGPHAPADRSELVKTLSVYQTADPETADPYEYKRVSDSEFSLCATFSLPTEQSESRYQGQFWTHPAGYHCYQFDLKQSWPW